MRLSGHLRLVDCWDQRFHRGLQTMRFSVLGWVFAQVPWFDLGVLQFDRHLSDHLHLDFEVVTRCLTFRFSDSSGLRLLWWISLLPLGQSRRRPAHNFRGIQFFFQSSGHWLVAWGRWKNRFVLPRQGFSPWVHQEFGWHGFGWWFQHHCSLVDLRISRVFATVDRYLVRHWPFPDRLVLWISVQALLRLLRS